MLYVISQKMQGFGKCRFAGIVASDKYGDVAELEFGEVSEATEVFEAD